MKMFMPLLSPAAGMLHHVLPEGSLLNAGEMIARCGQNSRERPRESADACINALSRLHGHRSRRIDWLALIGFPKSIRVRVKSMVPIVRTVIAARVRGRVRNGGRAWKGGRQRFRGCLSTGWIWKTLRR
jgi:hypothetical protein